MSFGLDFERLPIARPLAIFDTEDANSDQWQ